MPGFPKKVLFASTHLPIIGLSCGKQMEFGFSNKFTPKAFPTSNPVPFPACQTHFEFHFDCRSFSFISLVRVDSIFFFFHYKQWVRGLNSKNLWEEPGKSENSPAPNTHRQHCCLFYYEKLFIYFFNLIFKKNEAPDFWALEFCFFFFLINLFLAAWVLVVACKPSGCGTQA